MRRLSSVVAIMVMFCGLSFSSVARAQTTDLETGVYVDQLTGFTVTWDPTVFTGETQIVGGIRLTSDRGTVQFLTSTGASASDCVTQNSAGLGVADRDQVLTIPTFPAGTAAHDFVADPAHDVLIACVPVGAPETATTFLVIDMRTKNSGRDWDPLVGQVQPVIDSILYPDPTLLPTTGISGNIYVDPLYGWRVRFDPARYEAQYAGGTADSAFLSGVFFYSESDGESGGIWAERHDSIEECGAAQQKVNQDLPEFATEDPLLIGRLVKGEMNADLYSFVIDGQTYRTFAACQPLVTGGIQVEDVFLVSTFTVAEPAFDVAQAAWGEMLGSLSFLSPVPNGTPSE